jgi:hypothetical protein
MRGYAYISPAACGIPTKDVYCQEPSHDGKRWDIATFGKFRDAGGAWVILPPHMCEKRLRSPHDLVAVIDRDTGRRVQAHWGIWPPPGNVYLSYNLKCTECGLAVPAHGDHLQPIFDTLRRDGIELSDLAARLRS